MALDRDDILDVADEYTVAVAPTHAYAQSISEEYAKQIAAHPLVAGRTWKISVDRNFFAIGENGERISGISYTAWLDVLNVLGGRMAANATVFRGIPQESPEEIAVKVTRAVDDMAAFLGCHEKAS